VCVVYVCLCVCVFALEKVTLFVVCCVELRHVCLLFFCSACVFMQTQHRRAAVIYAYHHLETTTFA